MSIKYEVIYLKSYENPRELGEGIRAYRKRYNTRRPHERFGDQTPDEVYYKELKKAA
ncbi:integrase core domain-containing protein [Desulfosediminicola flagellatus]|uniref:integrase core domain-containing protein n=1 Tax=Desulfosediminicola flagellatus TaxID=2569541 RepID=UPI0010AD6638